MKLTIEGSPEEIKNVLDAISGSEEDVKIKAKDIYSKQIGIG